MSKMKNELKPCPFCGAHTQNGNGNLLKTVQYTPNRYAVACTCGANGSIVNSKAEARDSWNNRYALNDSLTWNPFRTSDEKVPVEFRGSLDSVSIASILQFFYTEKKTGILQIAHEEKKAAICLQRGNIIAASCNWGLQIGQILCDRGLISEEKLQKSLEKAKGSGKTVGEVLLTIENISRDDLLQATRFQIHEVVQDTLFWQEGSFLYQDYIVDFDRQGVEEISTIAILLEATVRTDELDETPAVCEEVL